jgi:hypothetical protein
MSEDKGPPNAPAPRRVSRWTPPPSSRNNPYRLVVRLVGIPLIAVAAVLLYRGLQARLVLPQCDSDTAKKTLEQVLKQLKLEPVRYAPIKTVLASKTEVVCNAVMPLPGGGNVVADYSFYWQGSKANMRYSIHREPAQSSWLDPRFRKKGRFDVRSRT